MARGLFALPFWTKRSARNAERIRSLRGRDGEACARCRRPLRFDLPEGHDQGPRIEAIVPGSDDPADLRLTHRRCNAAGLDHTAEVGERIRRKAEAELFAASRKRKRKAA